MVGSMKTKLTIGALVLVFVAGVLLLPIGGEAFSATNDKASGMDLSIYPQTKPVQPTRLLFIHHSVGGQLLAEPGPDVELASSIHVTHPNGGGLRKLLETEGYNVNEASYGSYIGESTDLFDWLPKFKNDMDRVLRTKFNDSVYTGEEKNQIVLFKSCYPNSRFVGTGSEPGNPDGPELTVWNAKATMLALLDELKKHPNTLFVYFTAPPNAPNFGGELLLKVLIRKAMRKPTTREMMSTQASLARTFNNWVKSPDGWLKNYPLKNVAVFDYYDELTDHGESNFSRYPTGKGDDSHPSRQGQQRAASAIVPFLNSALNRFATQ